MKAITYAVVAIAWTSISGCSATTLRCAVDGESSHVELISVPQDIGGATRYFKELCGFAYEAPEPEAREPL